MREATKREVLSVLTEPRTTQELSEILGVHYQTAYKYIRELVQQGDVSVLPIPRENGTLVYVKDSARIKDGAIRVPLGPKLVTLPELSKSLTSAPSQNEGLGSILAQLFCRSYFGQSNDALVNRFIGLMSNLESKKHFRLILESMRRVVKAGEQLLDIDDLWTDGPECYKLFGAVDPEDMRAMAETWLNISTELKKEGKR